jgi:hypothetical protein
MGAKLAMIAVALATGFLAGRLDATRQAAPAEPPAAQRVAGIGGVFFKARDPDALSVWYRDHLGLEVGGKTRHHVFLWRDHQDQALGRRCGRCSRTTRSTSALVRRRS